ncbi:MAG: phosphate signaling complex protein PhoU [Defluviitaleaceae bacterium]|nr:phosphate signaling complex protein PhoU [Defluviitaleaceae bacterium]MCL2275573.1 phosphate signaling complex protein PhoU [Defluviitaleaceae bacterium]
MRKRFENQLNDLNRMMAKMGELLEKSLSMTHNAMTGRDAELAEKVILHDISIDEMEKEIEALCMRLLMQQQPVARDLRVISAALKIITDMERIGDHAADIAENIGYMAKDDYTPNIEDTLKMIDITTQMVKDSVRAFVQNDLELAQMVFAKDDEVDALFLKIKMKVSEKLRTDASFGEQAIDLMMNAKHYERIGDHAENIAEWVEFSITGTHRKSTNGR